MAVTSADGIFEGPASCTDTELRSRQSVILQYDYTNACGANSVKFVSDAGSTTTFEIDESGNTVIAGNFSIAAGKRLNLEGSSGDTYFIFESGSVKLYVNGTVKGTWS